jgi:hypothetical protein
MLRGQGAEVSSLWLCDLGQVTCSLWALLSLLEDGAYQSHLPGLGAG